MLWGGQSYDFRTRDSVGFRFNSQDQGFGLRVHACANIGEVRAVDVCIRFGSVGFGLELGVCVCVCMCVRSARLCIDSLDQS